MDGEGSSAAAPSRTIESVRTFLAGYGRTPRKLEVAQLESWWFNLVLRVEADGEHLVLRRYGVTPPEEVRWELAVLQHLQRHGFPSVHPLPRSNLADELGEFLGKPAVPYAFVEGEQGCAFDWGFAVAETARAVAWLHELTEGLVVPHPRVRSGTESRRIIREMLDFVALRGVAAHEPTLRGFVEQAEQALDAFQKRLAPYSGTLRRGVVHHDAHCENVLFRDDRLVALIDFDDAHEGYLVADVAVMIANWADDGAPGEPLNLDKALNVTREYQLHRKLTDTGRELLPDFTLIFSALRRC
jgi:homoserine kinase type II